MAENIVIIGGGPGGYVAAIKAAQMGAKITLIEKDTLGGTCVNRGCISTKSLLYSADIFTKIKTAEIFGISVGKASLDFLAANERKDAIVKQLVAGITSLMNKRKDQIDVIEGIGTLLDSNMVGILGETKRIKADKIIIATGSKPSSSNIKGIGQGDVITSDEALSMDELPESIVIIGGGVIGLEFAQIMHRMGSKVVIVEKMPHILPMEDTEITDMLQHILTKDGIEIFTNATINSIKSEKKTGKLVSFSIENSADVHERMADKVLLAVGRVPNTENLGTERMGIAMEGDRIIANERMETNIPDVYAVGDVLGGPMLAHIAMEEGKCAAENCVGANRRVDFQGVPRCVFTSPEVASVGLTETEAKKEYGNIKIGRFPLIANGKALILNETRGMIKIITDAGYGQILGVHIISPHATELIAEAVLAIRMESTFEEIASTGHYHPTLSEAFMEAALDVEGKAIHS